MSYDQALLERKYQMDPVFRDLVDVLYEHAFSTAEINEAYFLAMHTDPKGGRMKKDGTQPTATKWWPDFLTPAPLYTEYQRPVADVICLDTYRKKRIAAGTFPRKNKGPK